MIQIAFYATEITRHAATTHIGTTSAMFHILPRSVLREVWFMGPKAELSDLREDKNPTSRCWE